MSRARGSAKPNPEMGSVLKCQLYGFSRQEYWSGVPFHGFVERSNEDINSKTFLKL